jgi:hypothetical protein
MLNPTRCRTSRAVPLGTRSVNSLPRSGFLGASAAVVVGVAVVVSAAACNFTLDLERVQCETNADCRSRGNEFAGSLCVDAVCEAPPVDERTSCLDRVRPSSDEPGPFEVTIPLIDLITHQPLEGVTADLCQKVDVACASPTATTVTAADGVVRLMVPANFSGYVSMSSEMIVPSRYFFNPAIDRDQEIPQLSLSIPPARAAILQQIGGDAALGDILLTVADCTGVAAEGVRLTLVPNADDTIGYYLVGGLPSTEATETDSTGYGGFTNLRSGTYNVTGALGDGTELGTISLVVEEGAITWSRIAPHL